MQDRTCHPAKRKPLLHSSGTRQYQKTYSQHEQTAVKKLSASDIFPAPKEYRHLQSFTDKKRTAACKARTRLSRWLQDFTKRSELLKQ